MGDDAVLIVLALLWAWLDGLLDGLALLLFGAAGLAAVAGLIVWAGHSLPTGQRPDAGPVCGAPDDDEMTQTGPDGEVLDLGPDPLDPRGDGTLRPGDPLFDALMGDGLPGALLAHRRDDGRWDVQRSPAPDDSPRTPGGQP